MNHIKLKPLVLATSIALGGAALLPTVASAQSVDGALRGTVQGTLQGVEVVATEKSTNRRRPMSISSDGSFQSKTMSPGDYTVEVLVDGTVVDTAEVTVELGKATTITLASQKALVEELLVTGKRIAAVDTSIAESGLVISTDELNALPVVRDLSDVTLLAPGVNQGDSAFGNFTSFGGSSVAENTSYINGLNTTNFRNGLGFSKVPFEFYETIQVKTGGYSAKYGRSTGGVINAVSKSGSNEFKFGANVYYETFTSTSPETYSAANDEDEYDETNFDVYASGPIIEDRVFFYALYSQNKFNQDSYFLIAEQGFLDETDESFYAVKLDAVITDGHTIEATAFSDTRDTVTDIVNWDPVTRETGTKVGDETAERGGDNWIVSYTGEMTDALTVKLSYGENEANRTTNPSSATIPVVLDYVDGAFLTVSDYTTFLVEAGEDKRKAFRMDLSYSIGDHFIEFGYDQEDNFSTQNAFNSGGVYSLNLVTPNWVNAPLSYNCTPAECPDDAAVRIRDYRNGGGFKVENQALYIQDTWDVSDNLTLELGVRYDEFANYNADGDLFVELKDQYAPRLSAVWDPTGDGKSKVFASYGRYFLPVASNTNIRLSGAETYIQSFYAWDGTSRGPDGEAIYDPSTLFRTQTFATGQVGDTRSLVDKNLESMYQDEIVVGYNYALDSGIELGVRYMNRDLKTSIEDVAIDAAVIDYYNTNGGWTAGGTVEETFSGFHQYVLTNPGADMNIYIPETDEFIDLSAAQLNYPEAERTYESLEFTFNRPYDGSWSLAGSYVYAKSEGNNEGYVRSDNGQDDAGITTNFDQPGLVDGAFGYLPNDRRHTVKVFGTYAITDRLNVGGNLLWQTGRPQNCFGTHPTDDFAAAYGNESFYCNANLVSDSTSTDPVLVPRGSLGETDDLIQLDVNVQYRMQFGDSDLLLSADIFNVLDEDSVQEVQEDSGSIGYGMPFRYQQPRTLRLTARYSFN